MNISPTVLITMIIQPLAVKAKASLFTFLMLEKGAFLNDVMQVGSYLCDTRCIDVIKTFFPSLYNFFLLDRLMTSFLPSTGRSLDCLLSNLGLTPQSLSSEDVIKLLKHLF